MERLVSQIERSFADVEQELADPAVLAAPEVPEALEVLAALAALVVEVPA